MSVGAIGRESNTGNKRRRNEDSFVVAPPLFAVADGMGGAQAGEVASKLAAAALKDTDPGTPGGEERVVALIQEATSPSAAACPVGVFERRRRRASTLRRPCRRRPRRRQGNDVRSSFPGAASCPCRLHAWGAILTAVSPDTARGRRSTSLRGRSIRTPFTYVPFIDPRSCARDAVAARLVRTVRGRRKLVGFDHHVVVAAGGISERRGVEAASSLAGAESTGLKARLEPTGWITCRYAPPGVHPAG